MRARTLLTQVLAVNIVLVSVTAFVAAVITRERFKDAVSGQGLLILVLAVMSVILLNSLLLRRRMEPLDRLLETMGRVDLASPGKRAVEPVEHPVERGLEAYHLVGVSPRGLYASPTRRQVGLLHRADQPLERLKAAAQQQGVGQERHEQRHHEHGELPPRAGIPHGQVDGD